MRIIFFGSDDFAALHLESLLKSRHTVAGCVTQPDTRQGRGMKVVLSPIKILAAEHSIDYIQPDTLKDPSVMAWLKERQADVFVVVAYGRLLTQDILNTPKLFAVNVHGSMLPRYRGAAPINWAILNGDARSGVTVQKMALALDAGDIIAQERIDIGPEEGADVLRAHMAKAGAKLLVKTLDGIEQGKYKLTPQDPGQVSHAPKLTKHMGKINWSDAAQVIHDQVRGLKPWPGTHTLYKGKMLKILNASVSVQAQRAKPGVVTAVDKQSFSVACGSGLLIIREVQPEAGKAMPARSFIAGHKIAIGARLE